MTCVFIGKEGRQDRRQKSCDERSKAQRGTYDKPGSTSTHRLGVEQKKSFSEDTWVQDFCLLCCLKLHTLWKHVVQPWERTPWSVEHDHPCLYLRGISGFTPKRAHSRPQGPSLPRFLNRGLSRLVGFTSSVTIIQPDLLPDSQHGLPYCWGKWGLRPHQRPSSSHAMPGAESWLVRIKSSSFKMSVAIDSSQLRLQIVNHHFPPLSTLWLPHKLMSPLPLAPLVTVLKNVLSTHLLPSAQLQDTIQRACHPQPFLTQALVWDETMTEWIQGVYGKRLQRSGGSKNSSKSRQ